EKRQAIEWTPPRVAQEPFAQILRTSETRAIIACRRFGTPHLLGCVECVQRGSLFSAWRQPWRRLPKSGAAFLSALSRVQARRQQISAISPEPAISFYIWPRAARCSLDVIGRNCEPDLPTPHCLRRSAAKSGRLQSPTT